MRPEHRQQLARHKLRKATRFIGPSFLRIPWPEIRAPMTRGQKLKADKAMAAMIALVEARILTNT